MTAIELAVIERDSGAANFSKILPRQIAVDKNYGT
jgi:hypothetical protein